MMMVAPLRFTNELNDKCMLCNEICSSPKKRIPLYAGASNKWNAFIFISYIQYKNDGNGSASDDGGGGAIGDGIDASKIYKMQVIFHWECSKVLDFVESPLLRFLFAGWFVRSFVFFTLFAFLNSFFFVLILKCIFFSSARCVAKFAFFLIHLNLYSRNSVRYNERRSGV